MNRPLRLAECFATHFVGERWYFTKCLLVSCGVFCVYFVGVRGFFTVCSQRYRKPLAAVGADLSCRIYVNTHEMGNEYAYLVMWKCVFDEMNARV